MDAVDDAALDAYLDTRLWEGKAGAFGYQDGIDWLEVLEGSESNVVGLPMERLAELLDAFERDSALVDPSLSHD
jgi:septum formation protein